MQIPRDVLIAGARAYWLHLGKTPEVAERMAADWVDEGGDCIVIMVAAIEAWETRPHPWGEPPVTSTDGDETCPECSAHGEPPYHEGWCLNK